MLHNIARIEKEPEKLLDGLNIIMKLVNAEKGIVAVKGIHKEAIEKLEKVNTNSQISVHALDNIYPMGEERAIVRETLEIPSGTGATSNGSRGSAVINSETVFRIREAVEEKKPLLDKDMTVAGKLKENASIHVLMDVPLGTSVANVLEMAGGLGKEYGELIMGGPFTGKRTLEAPVIKTTGGIIAAENFIPGLPKIGLFVCACGANKERLEEQAASMGSEVVGVEYCKQAKTGLKHTKV